MPKEPMLETAPGVAPPLGSDATPIETIADQVAEVKPDSKQEPQEKPWQIFLQSAKPKDIKERFIREIEKPLAAHGMQKYCVLALLEPKDSIDSYDLDAIFEALSKLNPDRSKDVLLILLSRGGSIEPAYQISKLCKSFAKDRFIAVVPRHAKSAATLVSIGADEIHMGPLGQLGPIDPQLGSLPALGVSQALKTIASVAEKHPGSAEMFARYLRLALTVEQIGYCDRISESAVQYAVRLLSTKPGLGARAEGIAQELVYGYKDHGFVIDIEEAKIHLGDEWIKTGTSELAAAEIIYSHFEWVNFYLGLAKSKRLVVTGGITLPDSILLFNERDE